MEVKIYREKENESLIYDDEALDKYNALISELGLFPVEEKKKCPNVYIILNEAMKKQLHALCPSSQSVENYKRTTIPLEVLEVYKFAKQNDMFEQFEIWYNDVQPDPMLIGMKYRSDSDRQNKYSWNMDKYLIARWGDCALELDELCSKGTEIIREKLTHKIKSHMSKLNLYLSDMDICIDEYLKNSIWSLDFNL